MIKFKQISLVILNIITPVLLYLNIVFAIFFTHGSGMGSEKFVQDNNIYITLAYLFIGLVHIFIIFKLTIFKKLIKNILIITLLVIYLTIAYSNLF